MGLGLDIAGLVCITVLSHARPHNDLEGHSNFASTIYRFSILQWSWFCYFGLGLGLLSSGLGLVIVVLFLRIWFCLNH